jgi:hypothetical protein
VLSITTATFLLDIIPTPRISYLIHYPDFRSFSQSGFNNGME